MSDGNERKEACHLSRRAKRQSQAAVASVVKLELLGLVMIVLCLIGLLESGWLGKNILAFYSAFWPGRGILPSHY